MCYLYYPESIHITKSKRFSPCPSSPLLSAASSGSELTLPSSLTGEDAVATSPVPEPGGCLLLSPLCSGTIMSGGVSVPEERDGRLVTLATSCSGSCGAGTSTGSSKHYGGNKNAITFISAIKIITYMQQAKNFSIHAKIHGELIIWKLHKTFQVYGMYLTNCISAI